jgi:outer membrane lipoprotein-sorting protein
MKNQVVVSDGKYSWIYLKERNEVQINDYDDSDEHLSPSYFLNLHRSDDFVYAITNSVVNSSGENVSRIDFKPLDDFSEYAKIGIDVNEKTSLPESIIVIMKDSGRYLFKKLKLTKMDKADPGIFIFNASKYPGIHIEDLRLD